MGKALFETNETARVQLERAFAVLPGLQKQMFEGPEEELRLTENAQPALVAASLAAYRAWRDATSLLPFAGAGHSLGEYSALVAAASIGFDDALRLVRARGLYMQEAVPVGEGAMAAVIKLSTTDIETTLANIEGVSIANYNSPEQTVISGATASVSDASAALKTAGGRVIPLQVSAPFHSPMMQPARERLTRDLEATDFAEPGFVVVSNVTAHPHLSATEIRTSLSEQVTGPVRWVESIITLYVLGCKEFIEFGPGNVLTGLVKRILNESEYPGVTTHNIGTPEDLEKYLEAK